MSTELIDTFNEILKKDASVCFIDKRWIKKLGANQWVDTLELHSRLERASKDNTENFFRVNLKQLTIEKLVQGLLGGSEEFAFVDATDHHVLTDKFSKLKPGVVVFYRTHLISPDVLRLLSKFIRHVQKDNSDWKFILYGKADKLTQITKDRLFIEQYYPEESRKTSITKKVLNTDLEPNDSVKPSRVPKVVFASLVITGIGILVYLGLGRTLNSVNNPVINQIEQDNQVESFQLQSVDQSNKSLQEIISDFKLRELEFEEILAGIDSAAEAEVISETDVADNVELINAKSTNEPVRIQRNVPVSLSNEVEQAILDNDLELLKLFDNKPMLSAGRNAASETPLIIAINNDNERIVEWLLQQGVAINSRDKYGRSALFYSAISGNELFLKRLLQANAEVSTGSNLSKTPLMAAVHNNHYESARLLLETKKAQVNAQDHSGWPALFYAVWNSDVKMSKLLIEHGADLRLVDNSGLNIEQIAGAASFDEWQNIR